MVFLWRRKNWQSPKTWQLKLLMSYSSSLHSGVSLQPPLSPPPPSPTISVPVRQRIIHFHPLSVCLGGGGRLGGWAWSILSGEDLGWLNSFPQVSSHWELRQSYFTLLCVKGCWLYKWGNEEVEQEALFSTEGPGAEWGGKGGWGGASMSKQMRLQKSFLSSFCLCLWYTPESCSAIVHASFAFWIPDISIQWEW